MNLDNPRAGALFPYALEAATQRTVFEFERTLTAIKEAQGAEGSTPATPGFGRARVAPALGDLTWARGAAPTPLGLLFFFLDTENIEIYTDAAYSAGTPFGQRIAHGLCAMSIASGLVTLTGVMEGTVLAFREIQEWKFSKPVFFGDTLHVEAEVVETKALPRLKGGAVTIKLNVLNQKNDVVQSGKWTVLMSSRPPA